jgi:peptide deformylase
MSVLPIITLPHPVLKKRASEVEAITPEILALLSDMAETMYAAPGIGLAANQVGMLVRAIVIDVDDPEEEDEEKYGLLKLLNPEIISHSGRIDSEEGCLSIPEVRETIQRHEIVTVQAINEKGEEIEVTANGMMSRCLQHEIDHLDGVLFIDHLSTLRREFVRKQIQKLAKPS